ncbi:S41 family peptidase [Gallaecimonas sp. GXIMD4217]|uniref:S41 family peptidase n=1 Tax=Gallaecimonas sp. GXIMD4217 TaxID=3131927 RepID=UPI00311AE3A3
MAKGSWLAGLCTGCLLTLAGLAIANHHAQTGSLPSPSKLLTEVLGQIQHFYVQDVAEDELIDKALSAMLASLDDYSRYLDEDEIRALHEMATGHYSGLGIEVDPQGDRLLVLGPIKGSPADRAGVKRGDEIISINGYRVGSRPLSYFSQELRRHHQEPVELVLVRAEQRLNLRIPPGDVQVHSVEAHELDADGLWLRLSHFQNNTAVEIREALEDADPHYLVLDLRDNPGGVLSAAVEVADLFLNEGLIVSTQGRASYANQRYHAERGQLLAGRPILVLINQGSASAAEILAGALKDNGRAQLLGDTSYGKGSIQSLIPLAGGSRALKLTTAYYLTPAGHRIHGLGIAPDLPAGQRLSSAAKRSIMKGRYPRARRAEVAVWPEAQDDPLLWEALAILADQDIQ